MLKEFPWLYPASDALEVNTLDVEAALTAEDYSGASLAIAELARRVACGLENLNLADLSKWLRALPASWRQQPEMLFVEGWTAISNIDLTTSLLAFQAVRQLYESTAQGLSLGDSPHLLMGACLAQSILLDFLGHYEQARRVFEQAHSLLPERSLSAPPWLPFDLSAAEIERLLQIDHCGLNRFILRALTSLDHPHDRDTLGKLCHNLGAIYLENGEPVQAQLWLERAFELKKSAYGQLPLAFTQVLLAECYRQLGQLTAAYQAIETALHTAKNLASPFLEGYAQLIKGAVYRDQRKPKQAATLLRQTIATMATTGNKLGLGQAQLELAICHRLNGQLAQSVELAKSALSVLPRSSNNFLFAQAQLKIGKLLLQEDIPAALTQLVGSSSHGSCPRTSILANWYLGTHHLARGERQAALPFAQIALELASDRRHLHLLAQEIPASLELFAAAFAEGLCPVGLVGVLNHAAVPDLDLLGAKEPAAGKLAKELGYLPGTPPIMIQLFGGLRILSFGHELDLEDVRSQKALQVIKLLALHQHASVSREKIIEALWDGQAGEGVNKTFDVALSTIRKFLAKHGLTGLLVRSGKNYQLNPRLNYSTDIALFLQHLEQGHLYWQDGQAAEASTEWEAALALYRGDLLSDEPYADWALAERERLSELYLDLLNNLAEVSLADKNYHRTIDLAKRILTYDNLRETA